MSPLGFHNQWCHRSKILGILESPAEDTMNNSTFADQLLILFVLELIRSDSIEVKEKFYSSVRAMRMRETECTHGFPGFQRVSDPEPTPVKGNSWAALQGEGRTCKPCTGARQPNLELLEICDDRPEELIAHTGRTVKTQIWTGTNSAFGWGTKESTVLLYERLATRGKKPDNVL